MTAAASMQNVVVFPTIDTDYRGLIERDCLRVAAGVHGASIENTLRYVAGRLKNAGVPLPLVEDETECVAAYMDAKIKAYREAAGLPDIDLWPGVRRCP